MLFRSVTTRSGDFFLKKSLMRPGWWVQSTEAERVLVGVALSPLVQTNRPEMFRLETEC